MDELKMFRMRLLGIAATMAAALAAGTVGYMVVERWSFFDSLYMTVITLATVGYGETNPLTPGGRIFTIFLILGGIGVVTYAFTSLTAVVIEGELSALFQRRRMDKAIAALSGHFIVCGAGHAGGVICSELKKTGRPFVLVDLDAEALKRHAERIGDEGFFRVQGNATDDETLKRAGVEKARGIFAVLATDQDNAFVALSAKGLNPTVRVVSSQKEIGVREKLFRSGADNVVNPEYIGGLRMVSEMIRPATVEFLDSMIRDKDSVARFDEVNIPEGSSFVGRPLEELRGQQGGVPLLVAVKNVQTGRYDINPDPKRPIQAGDRMVMVGEISGLKELRKRVEA